jgi:hypothetical protein
MQELAHSFFRIQTEFDPQRISWIGRIMDAAHEEIRRCGVPETYIARSSDYLADATHYDACVSVPAHYRQVRPYLQKLKAALYLSEIAPIIEDSANNAEYIKISVNASDENLLRLIASVRRTLSAGHEIEGDHQPWHESTTSWRR